MGSIHHEHIYIGMNQRFNPLLRTLANANRSTYSQTPLIVFTSFRVGLCFENVLDRYHALESKLIVDD